MSIPAADYRLLTTQARISATSVRARAVALGVSPGIVVGRLQYDRHLPWTHLNDLKVKYAEPLRRIRKNAGARRADRAPGSAALLSRLPAMKSRRTAGAALAAGSRAAFKLHGIFAFAPFVTLCPGRVGVMTRPSLVSQHGIRMLAGLPMVAMTNPARGFCAAGCQAACRPGLTTAAGLAAAAVCVP